MKYISHLFAIATLFFGAFTQTDPAKTLVLRNSLEKPADAEWLIVGAGPAGLATIGVLHDLGVPYKSLMWVDSEFNVGRIGEYYQNVPANNTTGPFIDFINNCSTFWECGAPSLAELREKDPQLFPTLGIIVPALQDITEYLRRYIPNHQGKLKQLHFKDGLWHANINTYSVSARHVILATGSHPREFNYEANQVIPLDHALDKATLATYVTPDTTIGVIGGSHSGILLLKYLYELQVKKIINLYRSPLTYATDMGDWTLNAYKGLKGTTAEWAKKILEGNPPPANIVRAYNDETARLKYLPKCDKLIYSVGYERNDIPLENYDGTYDDTTGIIGPRLFGIGLSFPEYYCDPLGNKDHRVGLTSFMEYAQRIIPQWLAGIGDTDVQRSELYRQHRKLLEKFESLFVIDLL